MENSNAMDNKADSGNGKHDSITRADCDRIDKNNDCVKTSSSLLISPKCVNDQLNKETEKSPKSNSQISKRMRTVDNSSIIEGCCNSYILGKVSTIAKCTSVKHGKSRVAKQKNNQDRRRADTKMFKISMKSRCDSLASRASSMSSTFVGTKSILGIYGLKSDVNCHLMRDEDPSLNDLLDGSYKWRGSCHDKGKKVSTTSENVLHSIKRALSNFPPVAEPENSTELDDMRKVQLCQLEYLSSEKKTVDACFNNLTSLNKEHMNMSQLYQPRDVLGRLTLTSTWNLDELIFDTPAPFTASQKKSPNSEFENLPSDNVHLPTFPWSLPLSCPSKPNIDSGKTSRSVSQGRWARIGLNFSIYGNSYNFYPDLCSLYDTVPPKQLKIHIDSENGKSMPTENASYSQQFDASFDKKHSGIGSFSDKLRPEVDKFSHRLDSSWVERCVEYSDNPKPVVEYNFSPRQRFEAGENVDNPTDVSTRKLQPCSLQTEIGNIQIPIDHHGIKIVSCSSSSYLKRTSIGQDKVLQDSCTTENSVQDNPPVVMAAAQILWEIANPTRSSTGKQVQNPGYNKWPKKPSQKTMRTRKMNPSMRKLEPADRAQPVVGDFNVTDQDIFESSMTEKKIKVARKHNHPR